MNKIPLSVFFYHLASKIFNVYSNTGGQFQPKENTKERSKSPKEELGSQSEKRQHPTR